MNFKKNLFAFFLMAAFCVPVFASSVDAKPSKTVTKEIKTLIEKLNLDYEKLDEETVRIKFMVNENGEMIVISTEESRLDKTLKAALNYHKLESKELTPYSLYIVPVKFELT